MKYNLICSALAFALILPAAQGAEIRTGQRTLERAPNHINLSTRVTNARGDSATREVSVERSADMRRRDVNITGPEGNTHTRSQTTNISREDNAINRDSHGTTFRGDAYSTSTRVEKSETGYTRQSQVIGPDGKTRQVNAEVMVDPSAGTATKQVRVERANGEEVTRTSVRTYTQEAQP